MADDEVTTGELQRSLNRVIEAIAEMRIEMKADRHALAGRIDTHGITLAIHEEQLKGIRAWKAWAAGVGGGTLIAIVEWVSKK